MPLKPNELADAMVAALPRAWKDVKGVDFPGGDPPDAKAAEDARVMFLAVARGLLTYLESHQGGSVRKITLTIPNLGDRDYTVANLDWDTDLA